MKYLCNHVDKKCGDCKHAKPHRADNVGVFDFFQMINTFFTELCHKNYSMCPIKNIAVICKPNFENVYPPTFKKGKK